ncbi:MAG: hypothetical protein WD135_00355, partial [Ferruginibacter sp.]
MNIAVHIDADALPTSFLWSHVLWLSTKEPQHQFLIFHSSKIILPSSLTSNCKSIPIRPTIKNRLLLHYWYQFKLPVLLKKEKAAIFISEHVVCSSRTTTPQILVIRNSFFNDDKKASNAIYQKYQKKNFPKCIQQSSGIIAVHEWVALQINTAYPEAIQKVSVVAPLLDRAFAPMLWEQRDSVLNLYSNDIEYFYCYHNSDTHPYMLLLLKAFSLFKKRMKSSLQLVLLQSIKEDPVKDFHLYKYRKDVHVHKAGDIAIEAAIAGAAFAGIFLQTDVLSDLGPMHCIKAGTVPIVPNKEQNNQILGKAAIYIEDT